MIMGLITGFYLKLAPEYLGGQGGKEEIPPVVSFPSLFLPLEAERDIIVVETRERREGKGK